MYSSNQIKKEEAALRADLVLNVISLLPVILVAVVTKSLIIVTDIFEMSKAVLLCFLSWSIVRKIAKGKTGYYDYGTGKLEVFGSIIISFSTLAGIIYVLYISIVRIIKPASINLEFMQLGVILHFLGLCVNSYWACRYYQLYKKEKSPIMKTFWITNRNDVITNCSVIAALSLYLVFKDRSWAVFIDPVCAIIFLIFPFISFVILIKNNLDDLLDKTLNEKLQMEILKVLSNNFIAYDEFYGVKSRRAGKMIFIDLVLGFDEEKTCKTIKDDCRQICSNIQNRIPQSKVNIVLHIEETEK